MNFNFTLTPIIFDGETGRHYNYFRDYDPSVGRYVESDPIGLWGGINAYGYAGGNPNKYIDTDGQYYVVAYIVVGGVVIYIIVNKIADMIDYWTRYIEQADKLYQSGVLLNNTSVTDPEWCERFSNDQQLLLDTLPYMGEAGLSSIGTTMNPIPMTKTDVLLDGAASELYRMGK